MAVTNSVLKWGRVAGIALLLLLPVPGWSAELLSLEVGQEAESYWISMEAVLAAPLPAVWQRLTDYAGFQRLSPSIQLSEVLAVVGPKEHRVRTRSQLCVLIFCGDIVQVQRMRQLSMGELQADIEPEGSDFESGQIVWRLQPKSGGTHLRFNARLRPAFRVPPLIGPWVVKHVLQREALTIVTSLERLAGAAP